MRPVLSPQQAVDLDRAARSRGITTDVLMENAGRAVARASVDLLGGVYGRRVVVVCGKGNNGGDGLVAARHLARDGVRVAVVLMEPAESLRDQAAENLARLGSLDVRVRAFGDAALDHELARADLAIDAIFGTGFRGIPEDDWAAAIVDLNGATAPVLAVDIPSGVNGETGAVEGEAVRATLTVTFGAPKIGVMLMPGAELAGTVRVVDIGFPDELLDDAGVWLMEPSDVASVLPVRGSDSHKRASGVLLVVAGSRGMTGAAQLIAEAAGRIGTGLVIVATPQSALPAAQASITEAVFQPLPETSAGSIATGAVDIVLERLGNAHALAIGPGLTAQEQTVAFVRDLVRACPVPAVIDADALNAFAGRAAELTVRRSDAVLTPHIGEFTRLSGVKARDLEKDRLGHARSLAAQTRAVTLLKGSRTVIAAPGGEARINVTGSPVLATAGSGDVLTGVIGGLLARGVSPMDAAGAGAYLHGLAGILAGSELGEGTIAGDLVERIPAAVERVEAG